MNYPQESHYKSWMEEYYASMEPEWRLNIDQVRKYFQSIKMFFSAIKTQNKKITRYEFASREIGPEFRIKFENGKRITIVCNTFFAYCSSIQYLFYDSKDPRHHMISDIVSAV